MLNISAHYQHRQEISGILALVQAHAAEECSPGDALGPRENDMALANNRCPITNRFGRRAHRPGLVFPRRQGKFACHFLLALFIVFTPHPLAAQTSSSEADSGVQTEYRIKALFLTRLARFVEWPPETFRGPETPLVIAILGKDPLGASLENVLSGKTLNGRPWVIVRAQHVQDALDSQILFISSSEGRREQHILEKLKGRSILTVGEKKDFIRHGGMVNLARDGNTFRFEINPDAGERVGIKISSQILSLARITRDEVLREEGADVQP